MIKKKKFPSVCLFLPTQEETERKTGSSFVQNSWVNRAPFFFNKQSSKLVGNQEESGEQKKKKPALFEPKRGGKQGVKKSPRKPFFISAENKDPHTSTPLFFHLLTLAKLVGPPVFFFLLSFVGCRSSSPTTCY